MATIYRFIVETRESRGGAGRSSVSGDGIPRKTTAKKGKWVSIFGGEKGGVEHNRKMRAINPLLNKATGGWWEKGMRVGRASMGLVKRNTETGQIALSGPAIAIIIAFIIQMILKLQAYERNKATERNNQNFKMFENGYGTMRGEYDLSVNIWNGARTYNQNK